MEQDRVVSRRRRVVLGALGSGLFAFGVARAQLFGKVPRVLPPGESVYDLRGDASVNGRPISGETRIAPNGTLRTAADSQLIFVVGKDAFLLRENSTLELSGGDAFVHVMRLLSGAVLAVFGKSEHRLTTPTATVGIRGTGLYAEAQADRTYLCTCYGTVEIGALGTSERETVATAHHEAPRYIAAAGDARITPAPMINHTDEELMLIETLVGRVPPFVPLGEVRGGRTGY